MLLARGVGRQREMAIRTALGAGRVRIVRQILLENLVLGLISAGVGLLLAWGLTMGMSHFLTSPARRQHSAELGGVPRRVCDCGTFQFDLRIDSGEEDVIRRSQPLAEVGRSDRNRSRRLSSAPGFVIAEVALSLMLLVCTGLVLMQLWRMQHLDFGYTTDHLLTLEINVSPGDYAGKDLDASFYRPLADKVRAIPGVTGVGYNRLIPLLNGGGTAASTWSASRPIRRITSDWPKYAWCLPAGIRQWD